jgi:hypothetical protein
LHSFPSPAKIRYQSIPDLLAEYYSVPHHQYKRATVELN